MANVIIILAIVLILGSAISYIVRQKKKGVKCIGCPSGGCCGGHNHKDGEACGCGCGSYE